MEIKNVSNILGGIISETGSTHQNVTFAELFMGEIFNYSISCFLREYPTSNCQFETQSHTLLVSHMQALTSQRELDESCFKTEET